MMGGQQVEDRRQALCAWLTANGVDADRVPQWSDLYIDTADSGARTLHAELFDVDDNGRHILNERGDQVAVRPVSVPLLVDPPEWWQPHIKPTREQLLAAVDAVKELHRAAEHHGQTICVECSALDDQGSTDNAPVSHPCATLTAMASAAAR